MKFCRRLLKNEKEKANSTTQTGQKSIIYSKDENKNYNCFDSGQTCERIAI